MPLHSLRTSVIGLVSILALAALAPASARGQDAPTTDQAGIDAEARSLFEAGRTAFAAGRFEAALARFRDAYELSGRPELLYNIGTAADRMRRDGEALEAFRAYLAALPEASNRLEVESRIEVLDRAVADDEARREPAPAAAPAALEASTTAEREAERGATGSITEEWWFWTLIGVVVVGAGVGIGVGVATSSSDTTQAPLPGTTGSVAIALGAW